MKTQLPVAVIKKKSTGPDVYSNRPAAMIPAKFPSCQNRWPNFLTGEGRVSLLSHFPSDFSIV